MFAYGDMSLDRCTNQRKEKRWLKAEFSRKSTLFCVINNGSCFFIKDDVNKQTSTDIALNPKYLRKVDLPTLSINHCIFLGKGKLSSKQGLGLSTLDETAIDNTAIFAIDFNKLHFTSQAQLNNIGQWQELKQVTPTLPALHASILSLAKALVHWHDTHKFCGLCGESNLAVEAGHARRCTNCRNMTFPRTDPAVIMLVEKMFDDGIPRCLLGRQSSWSPGVYSTMAGFVDPGETLEQAVIREVIEETGISVNSPQYIASQPWPFPGTVMIGFTAVATSERIDISQDSLEDAQWFSREQLALFGSAAMNIEQKNAKGNVSAQFKMSSNNSISAYLIKAWKNKEIGVY